MTYFLALGDCNKFFGWGAEHWVHHARFSKANRTIWSCNNCDLANHHLRVHEQIEIARQFPRGQKCNYGFKPPKPRFTKAALGAKVFSSRSKLVRATKNEVRIEKVTWEYPGCKKSRDIGDRPGDSRADAGRMTRAAGGAEAEAEGLRLLPSFEGLEGNGS